MPCAAVIQIRLTQPQIRLARSTHNTSTDQPRKQDRHQPNPTASMSQTLHTSPSGCGPNLPDFPSAAHPPVASVRWRDGQHLTTLSRIKLFVDCNRESLDERQ